MLHNTHSLPVRFDDLMIPSAGVYDSVPLWYCLGSPGPSRTPSAVLPAGAAPVAPFSGAFGSGTFTIAYEDAQGGPAVWTNPVLEYSWLPRFVEPQPGLPDAWDAPLIYEDRRHAFYVKTTERFRSPWLYPGYGVAGGLLGDDNLKISPPVLRQPVASAKAKPIVAPSAAPIDPATVQRYLRQSADLNAALNLPTVVTYQGRVISPTGSGPGAPPIADRENGRGA